MKGITLFQDMCGKIIDKSHLDFHVTSKAKIIKALLNLGLDVNPDWLKNRCNDPAIAALLEILEEYKKSEPRPSRARVIIPIIEYAISLMANDLFFKERGYWWIHQIIKRHASFRHCAYFPPHTWYPNMRPGGEEIPDVKIEDQYQDWYHINVMKDLDEMPEDLKEKIIAENREWMKQNEPGKLL